EDDLRLDRYLRRADVEPLDELLDAVDATGDLVDHEGIAGGIGYHLAALRQDRLHRRHHRRGAAVVDADQPRLDGHRRVAGPRAARLPPPRRAAGRCATGATGVTSGAAAVVAADWLDQASNAVRSEPILTRTWPSRRST